MITRPQTTRPKPSWSDLGVDAPKFRPLVREHEEDRNALHFVLGFASVAMAAFIIGMIALALSMPPAPEPARTGKTWTQRR